MRAARGEGWITASAFGLVVMATWTLVVKYLVPVLWAMAERGAGHSVATIPIMWDFWWVAHLALAWLLWSRHPLAWGAGAVVAVVEIVIVAVKFILFYRHPEWTFWKLLWLTNKMYVLTFFVVFLSVLLKRGRP